MFTVSDPILVTSSWPNANQRMNDSGTFLLSNGNGLIFASGRNYPSGSFATINGVAGEISDSDINEGDVENFIESPYGGGFSYDYSSGAGDGLYVSSIGTNENDLFIYSFTGLTASRLDYRTVSPDFLIDIAGGGQATINYVGSVGKWVWLIEDQSFDPRILTMSITSTSVVELQISTELFLPIDSYILYGESPAASPVGQDGDMVFFIPVEQYSPSYLTYVTCSRLRVTASGAIDLYNFGFNIPDSGTISPIGIAGNPNSEDFILLYLLDYSEIKAIPGKLDETGGLLFGTPETIIPSDGSVLGGIAWQKGLSSAICAISYDITVETIRVLRLEVDNLTVTPVWDDSQTFEGSTFIRRPSVSFDESSNKVVIGVYGDGSAFMPVSEAPYVILAEGEKPATSVFWGNHSLQKELAGSSEGRLSKLQTVSIIPSRQGQPYIPPTSPTSPQTSVTSDINYVCERVI